MDNLLFIAGIIIAALGGGFAYSRYKNHQISQLEKQAKDLSEKKARAEYGRISAEKRADAAEASRDFERKVHEAIADRKETAADSDTPLSDEDMRIAKDIMDNHRD